MECPRCRLENPPTAERCDCGYDFLEGVVRESYLQDHLARKAGRAPMVPSAESAARVQKEVQSEVRPWARYWARTFDYALFSIPAGLLLVTTAPRTFAHAGGEQLLGLLILFLWVFVEAFLLAVFDTTPGKWLLNTRISHSDGRPMSYSDALGRSLKVWWRGMGAGFPIASVVTMIVGHNRLKRNGITSWDSEGDLCLDHGPIGIARILALILFFLMYAVLITIGRAV